MDLGFLSVSDLCVRVGAKTPETGAQYVLALEAIIPIARLAIGEPGRALPLAHSGDRRQAPRAPMRMAMRLRCLRFTQSGSGRDW